MAAKESNQSFLEVISAQPEEWVQKVHITQSLNGMRWATCLDGVQSFS